MRIEHSTGLGWLRVSYQEGELSGGTDEVVSRVTGFLGVILGPNHVRYSPRPRMIDVDRREFMILPVGEPVS